jgi:DNA invertase Pin-like site-specific DNA recombinase
LDDIRARKIDVIVVYKVDRLTRSLADFAKLVELFDAHGVSFVSVTQQFNTTTSMGRLTLNVLLSFAQFEREVTSERIRDKIVHSHETLGEYRVRWPYITLRKTIRHRPRHRCDDLAFCPIISEGSLVILRKRLPLHQGEM